MSKQYTKRGFMQLELIDSIRKAKAYRLQSDWNASQWLSKVDAKCKVYNVKRIKQFQKGFQVFEVVVKPHKAFNFLFWRTNERGKKWRCDTFCVRREKCSLQRFVEEMEGNNRILDCFHFESNEYGSDYTRNDKAKFNGALFSFYRLGQRTKI